MVGVGATAAGIEGIGTALSVIGGALSLVGIRADTAGVEFLLALRVGGGQRNSGKSQGEEGREADHCEVCGSVFGLDESGIDV